MGSFALANLAFFRRPIRACKHVRAPDYGAFLTQDQGRPVQDLFLYVLIMPAFFADVRMMSAMGYSGQATVNADCAPFNYPTASSSGGTVMSLLGP